MQEFYKCKNLFATVAANCGLMFQLCFNWLGLCFSIFNGHRKIEIASFISLNAAHYTSKCHFRWRESELALFKSPSKSADSFITVFIPYLERVLNRSFWGVPQSK